MRLIPMAVLLLIGLAPLTTAETIAEVDADVEPYGHSGVCLYYQTPYEPPLFHYTDHWFCFSPSPHDECMFYERNKMGPSYETICRNP